MHEICMRNAWDMHEICLKFALDLPKKCLKHGWDMHEICMRYAWDMPEICLRYAWDMPEIFPRNDLQIPERCTWLWLGWNKSRTWWEADCVTDWVTKRLLEMLTHLKMDQTSLKSFPCQINNLFISSKESTTHGRMKYVKANQIVAFYLDYFLINIHF